MDSEGFVDSVEEKLKSFAPVLIKNIINKQLSQNPAISDLQVTQFVVNDGWIGVALGPQRGGRVVRRITDLEGHSYR